MDDGTRSIRHSRTDVINGAHRALDPLDAAVGYLRVCTRRRTTSWTGGRAAQAVVLTIKAAVDAASKRLRPAGIDFCFAGSAALAVTLGHRWNAMGPTQFHEYV